MAKLAVLIKVLPVGLEVNLDDLVERIKKILPSKYEVKDYKKEPIAFGLHALILSIIMPEDVKGGTEELEKTISSIEGVSEVSVEYVSRV